jgi:hypothetical protein
MRFGCGIDILLNWLNRKDCGNTQHAPEKPGNRLRRRKRFHGKEKQGEANRIFMDEIYQ